MSLGKRRWRSRFDLNALILAVFLNCQAVNLILQAYIPQLSSLGLPGVVAFCCVLYAFRAKRILRMRIGIPAVLLLFYGATYVLCGAKSAVSIIEVCVYVVIPFVFCTLNFDLKRTIKYSMVLTSPAILVLERVFPKTWHGGISMGISYAFLASVASALIYIWFYFMKDDKRQQIIFGVIAAINIVYFYEILVYGSRGPAMSIVILAALLVFFYFDRSGRLRCKKIGLFMVVITACSFIMVIGDEWLGILSRILNSMDISISIIDKSYQLTQKESVLNGRSPIYSMTFAGIMDSPLWGNGFDMFKANTGIVYPHNLFLQFLYDGGFLLFCFIVIPLTYSSIRIMRAPRPKLIICWVYLFTISVPGALFSGDIWQKYTFWMFMAFCIYHGLPKMRIINRKSRMNGWR